MDTLLKIIFPFAAITCGKLNAFTPLTSFRSNRRFGRKPVQKSAIEKPFADQIQNFRNPPPDCLSPAPQKLRGFILGIVLEYNFSEHPVIELVEIFKALLNIVDENHRILESVRCVRTYFGAEQFPPQQ